MSRLSKLYTSVLDDVGALGQEPSFLDLSNTPKRVATMLRDELLLSYKEGEIDALRSRFTKFPAPGERGTQATMVTEVGIPFYSMCAHHMIPFFGRVSVGYIPNEYIVGLSKIPRAVDFFSRKLQVQERLTDEVADFLVDELDPIGVIVVVEARHLCMEMRGVHKPGVVTRTSSIRGKAEDSAVRAEFYELIRVTL